MNDLTEIRTLTERFFDGETTLAEERQLYALYQRTDLPADLAALRPMFMDLALLPTHDADTPGMQPAPAATGPHRIGRWAAAAAVAALTGGGAWLLMPSGSNDEGEECVAYIYGQRTTDPTVVLGEMHHTMSTLAASSGTFQMEEELKSLFSND